MPVLSSSDKSSLALPGKKGVCFTLRNPKTAMDHAQKTAYLQPSWNYGWCAERCEHQPSNMEFIPMTWGGGKNFESKVAGIQQEIANGHCQRVLAFNEPDKEHQSDMPVSKVLSLWPALEALNVPLCSPSCANPYSENGSADACCQGVGGCWMQTFMKQVESQGLRVDYLGVHWYGGPNFNAFKTRMETIYQVYGGTRPLMITEFAVADWTAAKKTVDDNKYTQAQVLKFMQKALPWLEAQDWIAGYAWFPFAATCPQGVCSALFTKQGKATALGRYYQSVSADNPSGNQDEKVWSG